MEEGMRIKIFPDTDVMSYISLIHSEGFNCKTSGQYIYVTHKRNKEWDKDKLGKLIRTKRQMKNMDKAKLSKALNIHVYTLDKWELGQAVPMSYNMKNLMEILNIKEREIKECRTQKQ